MDFGYVNSFACDQILSAVSNKQVLFSLDVALVKKHSIGAVQWFWAGDHTMGLLNVCPSSSYSYLKTRREIRLVVILDAFMSPVVIID